MSASLQDLLSTLFGQWREVADETIRCLGAEKAALFVHLYNDTLDLFTATDAYSKEELAASLVRHDLIGLFKELQCLQVLFLSGNYPVAHRNLRFVWELMFRAYYADQHAANHGADEKNFWLSEREKENGLNWSCIGSARTGTSPSRE